ncbi:MAG: glycosyltransferase family 9 protein [Candidatus Omnitrophota bacterium]
MQSINKILFITLSNIGDVILTLPCFDLLRNNFPDAKISIMTGPRPEMLFKNNPYVDKVIIYDKRITWQNKRALVNSLRKENFDLIIDLRNSMFPFLIGSKYRMPFTKKAPSFFHMRARHLYKIKYQISKIKNITQSQNQKSLYVSQEDKDYVKKLLEGNNMTDKDKIVLIGPGARSHIKRYTKEGFVNICQSLIKDATIKIILVGDEDDSKVANEINKEVKTNIFNFCAKISLLQLAYLIEKSVLLISCDSAIMHLASYLNKPVIAIFGPTNEVKYGPWSDNSVVARSNLKCVPCEVALCKHDHECMKNLEPQKIVEAAKKLLDL